jgi:Rrf2 family protein
MDVTKRSDYACRMLRTAWENRGTYVSVAEAAEDAEIPYAFARGIQHDLVKNGLLTTTRGSGGGFALACDPETTTLLDVVRSVQGPISVAPCSSYEHPCSFSDTCAFHQLWTGADMLLEAYLDSILLVDFFALSGSHPSIQMAKRGAGFPDLPPVKRTHESQNASGEAEREGEKEATAAAAQSLEAQD